MYLWLDKPVVMLPVSGIVKDFNLRVYPSQSELCMNENAFLLIITLLLFYSNFSRT